MSYLTVTHRVDEKTEVTFACSSVAEAHHLRWMLRTIKLSVVRSDVPLPPTADVVALPERTRT